MTGEEFSIEPIEAAGLDPLDKAAREEQKRDEAVSRDEGVPPEMRESGLVTKFKIIETQTYRAVSSKGKHENF